jgi:hypothetical protein
VNSGFSLFEAMPSHRLARQQLESRLNLPRLFAAIDADPRIVGAGVVYIDDRFNVFVLREFQPICSKVPKKVILHEAPRYTAPQQFANQVKEDRKRARIIGEAVNTTLSCAGAVISWFVVITGSAAIPVSGGLSTAAVVVAYSAAVASTAQCVVGGTRTVMEVQDPSFNDRLDSEEWYQTTMQVLDGVALAGAATSALTALRFVNTTRAASGKSMREVLRGLNRQERRRLTDELLQMNNPALTPALRKLRQVAGSMPRRISNTEIRKITLNHIHDAIGAGVSVSGSAYSGNLNLLGSQAKAIAIGLYEEFE